MFLSRWSLVRLQDKRRKTLFFLPVVSQVIHNSYFIINKDSLQFDWVIEITYSPPQCRQRVNRQVKSPLFCYNREKLCFWANFIQSNELLCYSYRVQPRQPFMVSKHSSQRPFSFSVTVVKRRMNPKVFTCQPGWQKARVCKVLQSGRLANLCRANKRATQVNEMAERTEGRNAVWGGGVNPRSAGNENENVALHHRICQ